MIDIKNQAYNDREEQRKQQAGEIGTRAVGAAAIGARVTSKCRHHDDQQPDCAGNVVASGGDPIGAGALTKETTVEVGDSFATASA